MSINKKPVNGFWLQLEREEEEGFWQKVQTMLLCYGGCSKLVAAISRGDDDTHY